MKDNNKMKNQYRVNGQIHVREVRVVSDNGSEVMPTRQALDMARQQGVDLVEISPNAQPPVCRIIDYSKFLYQQKKRQKEMKQKQVKVEVKEIRFGPQTDAHDYQFKLKHAQEFLEEGNKVRAYVFFRGRSILFKEQGEVLLLRFANDLEEYAKVEQLPTGYKTMNYGDCILEKRRASGLGWDEAVFLNIRGEICEGTVSNIFFVKDGNIYTPEKCCGILPGIMRGYLMENYTVEEGVFFPEDLGQFSECFVTNSLMGVMPVMQLGERVFERRGMADCLRKEYRREVQRIILS